MPTQLSKKKKAKHDEKTKEDRPIRRFFIKALINISAVIVLLLSLFVFAIYIGFFGPVPSEKELNNINHMEASQVFSSDGKLLGKFYIQDRSAVRYSEISPNVIHALVATEDSRFYDHSGIDVISLLRVLVKTVIMQDRNGGGGSTISQQLIKNIFGRKQYKHLSTPITKVKEMIAAYRLEQIYTKEEILTHYLNTVPFGDNTFGIASAAEHFFNKQPKNLSISESAVIIGMLKANYTYNPRLFPDNSLRRRNVVINLMVKNDYLNEAESIPIKKQPLDLNCKGLNEEEGLASYFREQIRQKAKIWCEVNTTEEGTPYNLYTDGLKIYTTLNSKLQEYAEKAISLHMKSLQSIFDNHIKGKEPWKSNQTLLNAAMKQTSRYRELQKSNAKEDEIRKAFNTKVPMEIFTWQGEQKVEITPLDSIKHYLSFLQAGFIAIDPHTGQTKAWVGGINHKYFKYDHVDIDTKRQVGSTFKPIVYAAAIEAGMLPCDYISAEKVTYKNYNNWTPSNGEDNYDKKYSMMGALTNSVNTVAVNLLDQTGIGKTISLAVKMGIQSDLPSVPSLALGTANISITELASVYSTFINHGAPVTPYTIERIEDKYGNVLYENKQKPLPTIMTEETCQLMIEMMKSVVNRGTASRLRWKYNLTNDLAGKTGTTQSNTDGWFAAITPDLVMISWVGADNPAFHFGNTTLGQGANTALPITAHFMKLINADTQLQRISNSKFATPRQYVIEMLDCSPVKDDKNLIEQIFGKKDKDVKKDFGDSLAIEKVEKSLGEKIKGLFKKKKK